MGFDRFFRLKTHKFSLLIEIQRFYLPYIAWLVILLLGYKLSGYEPIWGFFNKTLFADAPAFSLRELDNRPTGLFIILLYFGSLIWGSAHGFTAKKIMEMELSFDQPFFTANSSHLVSLWTHLIDRTRIPTVTVDILATGDLLYTGELYHYEENESGISSIATKRTRRVLAKIDDVKDGSEEDFAIPGEITYFFGSQIKNVNIRSIEHEEKHFVFLADDLLAETKDLEERLSKMLKASK